MSTGEAPKRFGGISPGGEADLRALHSIDIPFASVFTPDYKVFKKNGGRDEVHKIHKAEEDVDRYLWFTSVYDSSNSIQTYRSGDRYRGFKLASSFLGLSFTASERRLYEGGFQGALPNVLFVLRSTANSMTAFSAELSLSTAQLTAEPGPPVYAYCGVESVAVTEANKISNRVIAWFSGVFDPPTNAVRPLVTVKKGGVWFYSGVSFDPGFDHVTRNFYVLSPTVSAAMVMYTQIGSYYAATQGAVTRTGGSAGLPAPYMLVSTDGGLNYSPISAAYMISGITFPSDLTHMRMWIDHAGMTALDDVYMVWGPRLDFAGIGHGGPANQTSVWVGTDLSSLTQVTDIPQGGFSSVVVTPAFTNTRHNLIGLVREQDATAFANFTVHADLMVTDDLGQTWSARPLPAPAFYTLGVFPIDRAQLGVRVIDPVTSTISIYRSDDFGVTWVKGEQVAANSKLPSALNFRDIRGGSDQVRIGMSPNATSAQDPMTPSRYDARLKPEPYKP